MSTNLAITIAEIDKCIVDEYTFWKEIYEGVYSDVDVNDGVNLNIVRNHIMYEKTRCEELLGECFHLYPDSYFYPIPNELPEDFMASPKRLPLPFIGMIFKAESKQPFSEVMKFNWYEELI